MYRNGSNYRVMTWEDEQRRRRTVRSGAPMFVFDEVMTPYPFDSPRFIAEDFNPSWFYANVQVSLQNALMDPVLAFDRFTYMK